MAHSQKPKPTPLVNGALWATVFLTGAEILAVEIVGARLITPQFGVSLYVWSSLIAVTLIALAVGYALGGPLADRRAAQGDVCLLLLAAALALGSVPPLTGPVLTIASDYGLRLGSLLSAGLLFTPALIALAMITPYAVRLLARNPGRLGTAVGGVYALSTTGSVLGALATGFWLVPSIPLPRIFILLAFGLVGAAALLWVVDWMWRAWLTALLLAGTLVALWGTDLSIGMIGGTRGGPERFRPLFTGQSLYGEWRVVEAPDTDHTRLLLLNGIIQGGVDASGVSIFPYSHLMERLLDAWHPAPRRLLLIGLGSGVMATSLQRTGGAPVEIDVAEIDPMAVELAQRYFGYVPPAGPTRPGRLFIEDGRRVLNRRDRRYDAVILDAYAAEALPFHLLSVEAFQAVRQQLEPDGLLLINDREPAGSPASQGLQALTRTLRAIFPVVEVYESKTGGALDSRFVVASLSMAVRPESVGVTLETGPYRGRQITAGISPIDDRDGQLLTDAFNPMEWLDAPVAEAMREATRRYLR